MNAASRRNKRQLGMGATITLAAVLILSLLADSYAIYRIYVQRMGYALDYYPFWTGGREVVWNQHNPYDPAVTLSIQQAIYGRPALPEENQHGYAYPAYAPFVVLPFIALPFHISASLWIAGQQVLVVAAVVLTLQATNGTTRGPIGRWRLLLLSLAAMTFRYSMIVFVLGQTSIWVLSGLALALWAARRQHNILAGVALAAAAIKPQLVILPALALLVSQPSQSRRSTAVTMGGVLAVLVGCSFLFAGPWVTDYWHQLQAYRDYSTTEFPLVALAEKWLSPSMSQVLNLAVIAVLLGVLALVVWRWRGSNQPALPVALAVVTTQLVAPQTGSYNLVLLLLPAVMILESLRGRQLKRRWTAMAGRTLVGIDLLIAPWLLWLMAQKGEGGQWDQVILPVVLLAVMATALRK
jgi:hypothetical protein